MRKTDGPITTGFRARARVQRPQIKCYSPIITAREARIFLFRASNLHFIEPVCCCSNSAVSSQLAKKVSPSKQPHPTAAKSTLRPLADSHCVFPRLHVKFEILVVSPATLQAHPHVVFTSIVPVQRTVKECTAWCA